jgi:outer membrane receptor protein involved in Fe transport
VGYRASNSVAGTRTNTAIKDIPVNIQVFTKELAEDLIIKNQVDFEAYNAALVNGGADRFSDNPIQQSYQNFLFRGFRQNWGLRDGIREYDPIDTQALSRVEVVKGPVAALYGLAYPGGVMNNITKTVDFAKDFTSIRLTGGWEGDYRATLDSNVTGNVKNQRIGIRLNGVYEKTKDVREHSEGKVEFKNVQFAWQPTPTTQVEYMIEEGYRAKPGGLGYISLGNEAGAPGNHSDIPLQIARPGVGWDWNWSNGVNPDSLEVHMYRGKITQKIGENFQVQGYMQYSSRLEIPGQGWDFSGSGGSDSWESAGSGYDAATNTITSTYHYRDWGNQMHAYGATGVYTLNFEKMKNTFAFGGNVWREDELSRASRPLNPAASAVKYTANVGVRTPVPPYPPTDLVPETDGGPNGNGYHHEDNSNDYYFANWQASFLDDRVKTNIGINRTNMKLVTWNNGASMSPDNTFKASKWSPLYGVVFAVTKEISIFGVHSTSLFPDSTKDSFGNQFSPIVGTNWEGGVKVELLDGKISGTVSYYQIKQTGGTQNAPNHENLNTQTWDRLSDAERALRFPGKTRADLFATGDIVAGGEAESKGIDIDLVFQPTRQLQIVTSFTHVDHKFVTSAIPDTIGQTFPQAIKDRYSLLGKYTFTDGALKNFAFGAGVWGGSKSLQDYQTWNGKQVARYEPARTVAELFAIYRFKLANYDASIQLNLKNILKTPDYVGWKATGSSAVLATERYEVPTPIVYRLTFGLDF